MLLGPKVPNPSSVDGDEKEGGDTGKSPKGVRRYVTQTR